MSISMLIEQVLGPKLPTVEGWDERYEIKQEPYEGIGEAREMTGIEKMERAALPVRQKRLDLARQ